VAREQGRYAQKASAQLFRIADFGFRIFLVFFSIRIPQSPFRNLMAGASGATQFRIRNVEFGILCFPFRIPHSTFRILVARPA